MAEAFIFFRCLLLIAARNSLCVHAKLDFEQSHWSYCLYTIYWNETDDSLHPFDVGCEWNAKCPDRRRNRVKHTQNWRQKNLRRRFSGCCAGTAVAYVT